MPAIEVERKFSSPGGLAGLRRAVEAAGGAAAGTAAFRDTYWDCKRTARLAAQDAWLRLRAPRERPAVWELKAPPAASSSSASVPPDDRRSGGERGVFEETAGVAAVARALAARGMVHVLLPEDVGDCPAAFEAELRKEGLEPFAAFDTERAKFTLADGVAVDADFASFGHCVVELEKMVAEEGEVEAADALLRATGERLGLGALGATGGKLETYLRRHVPSHVEMLVAAGILDP